ncbi:MAG TPA: proton-conducting transporter membrane subunit [Hyphomicrobium sp.]|nr:proton-conducting transporter membrane subunit [Hyphomicrobium sp.]
MTDTTLWLPLALTMPGALLLLCLFPSARARMPRLTVVAPIPTLAAALLAARDTSVTHTAHFFHAVLALDVAGTMLLAATAMLWICAALYAVAEMRGAPNAGNFSAWWLTAMFGNFGIFLSADLASFYLFLAVGTIGAYGLIIHTLTPDARRASVTYVGFALVGESSILIGLVLLATVAPGNSLLIRDAVAGLSTSPWRDLTIAFLVLGFSLKIGLVPLHLWMPLAYTAAPIPAAAVLSGAAVNAGVIGLIRFMPFDGGSANIGAVLATVGIVSTFYGVAVGINRANPKSVLAYSSVSQMGVIATLIGTGLATANAGVAVAAAFYAAHHALVKGGLFLATGIGVSGKRDEWLVFVPAVIIALGLAGLPLTGGYLAKEAVKPFIGEGTFAVFAALSSAGTTLLMLFFMKRLSDAPPDQKATQISLRLLTPWLAAAFFAIAIPWLLLLPLYARPLFEASSLADTWSTIWPILVGVALVVLWLRHGRQPREIDVTAEANFIRRVTSTCTSFFERAEVTLGQWQAGGVSLLVVTLVLTVILATGH